MAKRQTPKQQPNANGITARRQTLQALTSEIDALKRAQEDLKRSEQELSDFFDNASVPIHWIGPDGTILRANQAELNALGYSAEEYIGHPLSEFYADPAVIEDIQARLARGETLYDYEARMRAKDGSIKHVAISANVMWENGKFIHTRSVTRDITNRRQVERRIAAEHDVTRILADSRTLEQAAGKVLQAIGASLDWQFGAFWLLREEGDVLRCLETWHAPSMEFPEFEAVCRSWTYVPDLGLPGRIWKNRRPLWIPDVLKDTNFPRAPMAASEDLHGAFGFPVQFGERVFGVIEFFSRQVRQPNEALLQMVEAIGSEIGQFIERLRAQGELQRKNLHLQDALEEQEVYQAELRAQNDELTDSQNALENERRRYRDLFEFAPDGYLVTDLGGVILEANRAATSELNIPLPLLIGSPLIDRVAPDSTDSFHDRLHALRGEERSVQWELRLCPRGLPAFDTALTVMTVRDPAGRPIGFRWLIRDVTEQKRATEALNRSEEKLRQQAQELEQQLIASGRLVSLGELTASMAHEFNNPLGIIIGFTQDLLSEADPSGQNYQALTIIEEESRRCGKIIRELLQFARPGSAEFQPTDIRATIAKTLNLVSNYLYKQKIEAVTQIEENLPRIEADPQQLEQVLVNLYLNAIDAMLEGGKLSVTAKLAGDASSMLAIAVADTGFGIQDQELSRIFQPFYSAKKKKGLGLGLPICERIIKNHGGKIAVESRPAQGTTFNILLPLEQAPAP
jgi:PAS domain S-box-containing protein